MAQALPIASPDPLAALAELRPQVLRYVTGLVRDRGDAEDLTQETFLHAHRRLASLRDPDSVLPWLYSIATHVCLDRLRQQGRRRSHESDLDPEAVEPPGPAALESLRVEQAEMSDCVSGYVGRLSDSYRAVLLLHDVHGLTCPEIAELLGDSPGSVKVRLHRARKRLRAELASACSFSYDECGTLVCESVP
jgi:RNA polymerase sigma-70 factor, ECF subfamily